MSRRGLRGGSSARGVHEADQAEVPPLVPCEFDEGRQRRNQPQLDAGRDMSIDEVADRNHCDRGDRLRADPLSAGVVPRFEIARFEVVAEQRRRPHAFEPGRLDRMHPVRCRREGALERCAFGGIAWPSRDARTVAGKPVQRRVDAVDRPHRRRMRGVGSRRVRCELPDRVILAEVKQEGLGHVAIIAPVHRIRLQHR